ncbi:hypothetical protein MOV61_02930 [Neorhizobium sp. BETTINA12A]|uniref:hypothetical protein n=1 Tax=Neorhizobium sp. BETTINA12A TaxID=2908924 RepID=UPI001FF6CB8B|nr:hypothetical protein [Neorhizobium sp. BETTINA12A]MCJ9749670.1 hypothetical protein [Neorhizobium sp. BETTINA12A]
MTEDERTELQVRVVRLIDALVKAGLEDVTLEDFHAFAFFADALAPVWGTLPPLGEVLKDEDGPHYPALQRELDFLIGRGLVTVSHLSPDDRGGRWRLDIGFSLDLERASSWLTVAGQMPDEDPGLAAFLADLAYNFVEIPIGSRDDAARVDAAWSAPETSVGRFIELDGRSPSGRRGLNHSVEAARHFQAYASEGVVLTPAEQTSLYMSLVRRRAGA